MTKQKTGYLRVIATGARIVGELDRIIATAQFTTVTRDENGEIDPDWDGDSEVDWDSQRPDLGEDGQVFYVTEDGEDVPASACEFVPARGGRPIPLAPATVPASSPRTS